MGLGRLLLRIVIGGFFIGHGTQKLFGWFGGGGLDATGEGFEAIGLAPGRRNALVAGLAESGSGTLLALGLATPLAEATLISVMLTAIRTLHWKKGPWATNGGYEYNVVLISARAARRYDRRWRYAQGASVVRLPAGRLTTLEIEGSGGR